MRHMTTAGERRPEYMRVEAIFPGEPLPAHYQFAIDAGLTAPLHQPCDVLWGDYLIREYLRSHSVDMLPDGVTPAWEEYVIVDPQSGLPIYPDLPLGTFANSGSHLKVRLVRRRAQ